MARKDVNLVIKARDEAAKVVDSITAALNEFVGAQDDLESRSGKTTSSLGQLGAAFKKLDSAVSGLDVSTAITKQFADAEAQLRKMDAAAGETEQEVKGLAQQLRNAETATTRYASKLNGAAAAQAKQARATDKAKTNQKELSAAYTEAVATQTRLSRQQDRLPAQIARQTEAVAKASARYSDLSAEIAGTVTPSATLRSNFEASSRSVAEKTTRLTALRTEYANVQSNLRAAGSAVVLFGDASERATNDLAKQENILRRIGTNYTTLGQKTKSAERFQSSLAGTLKKSEAALRDQLDGIERASDAYVDLAVSAGRADQAVAAASGLTRGGLEQQLIEQGIASQKAKQEFEELSATARELGAEIGRVGVPTREMSQDLAMAAQRADEAQFKFLLQEETTQKLGRAFRELSGDMASVEATQNRFIAANNRLEASMGEVANDGLRARNAVRQLHQETDKAARSSRAAGDANRKAANDTNTLADAYRRLYGDTRRSLSVTQRLRGQILSLVAAYGGFYEVINILGQTVSAFQTLEAAQARLNVANEGDFEQTGKDLDFLRRTAARLGIDVGTLAQEYSKFSIATKNSNLEGANTRKIFLSVAEAARVNRSSTRELSGVFVALTQIVSKGAVQMEELRQQLGDRLPGALRIMADGLGVTTAELSKMVELGQVSADALVPFAEELDRRFGPGLGEALAGTSVALGRLKNAAFEALLTLGEGGFIDALTRLANDLTKVLNSADFESFLTRVSGALGGVLDVVGVLANNFDLVFAAAGAFIGLKLTPFLILAAAKFKAVTLAARAAGVSVAASATGFTTAAAGATGAARAVGVLRVALTALTSATGIGLLITAIGAGIGYWATQADLATEALNTHRDIVDKVKNAYDTAGGSVETFRVNVEKITVTELSDNVDRLEKAVRRAVGQFDQVVRRDGETAISDFFGLGNFTGASQEFNRELNEVLAKIRSGEINLRDFAGAIDEVTAKYRDDSAANKRYATQLIEQAKVVEELFEKYDEANDALKAKTGTTEEAEEALSRLANEAKDTSDEMSDLADRTKEFEDAMEELVKLGPELSDFAKEVAKIDVAFEAALTAARSLPDAIQRIAAEQAALQARNEALTGAQGRNVSSGLSGSLVDRIIGVESGGNPNAKNPLSSATGLGQFIESTWLRLFRENFPDRAASLTRTEILALRTNGTESRKLVELYVQENARILSAAGVQVNDPNLYLAHFLGAGGAKTLLKSAPGTIANDVLGAGQINANKSILDGKTREQVIAWATRKVGISKQELDVVESVQKTEQDRIEKAQEFRDERAADIEQQQFELSIAEKDLIAKEQAKAIREAELAAQEAGTKLTQQERDAINATVAAKFKKQSLEEREAAVKERAVEAEQKVTELTQKRAALQEQLEFAKEGGDSEKAEELRGKIEEVNTQLVTAIANAQQMWAAVGGSAADTAITKLDTAKVSAENFGKSADKNYLQWDRVADLFVNGLSSAFDNFAQAVANGESVGDAAANAFLQFASDFLRQIAQMIIQQAIFNALQSSFGGTGFGSLIGLGHTGGRVGSSRVGGGNSSRKINPAIFNAAQRYHTGGIVGLQPGEVPIIAKEGEEMLTQDDPRHALNGKGKGAGGGQGGNPMKIVNAFDSEGFLEAALATPRGHELFVNYVRANSSEISAAMAP